MSSAAASRFRLPGWRVLALAGGAALLWSGLSNWSASHAFFINQSESLPNWAFLVEKNSAPARGDYVFFRLPRTPLTVAHFGEKPAPFGKLVYGMPGDVVTRVGNQVFVNGKPFMRTKPLTRTGEPLTPGPTGVVPRGCYFVGTPHPDGFDSRYADIGFVCRSAILGTGVPVL